MITCIKIFVNGGDLVMKSALRSKRAMHKKTPTYGAFALSVVHSHWKQRDGTFVS